MSFKTLDIILKLRQNLLAGHELSPLISFISKLALTLITKRNGLSFLNYSETSISDLASDSILPLFIADKSGELPIRKALLNWDKQIIDEASANYFLYKIINSRIEQETAKKLKEADPFFGKILRSFNHLVETNRINKTEWFGVSYLIPKGESKLNQKPIEPEQIEAFPSFLFQGSNEQIITCLFKYLEDEAIYCVAVPLNALIRKVKHVNASFLQNRYSDTVNESIDEKMDIQLVVNSSINSVNKRIDEFYYKKGKFTSEESEIVKKLIKEFSVDLQDGGISRGMFEYLSPHLPDLTKEHFYNKYHQPLDYLLRLLKKEIATRLEEPNN